LEGVVAARKLGDALVEFQLLCLGWFFCAGSQFFREY